eukprot:GHRQ01018518.1.p2 GENE.GHRQ01018518.1~~GHRQ01018518.1.p2  ORF type:complete len:190 (+),score=51.22 GHRQ01018518.1:266-835(+)
MHKQLQHCRHDIRSQGRICSASSQHVAVQARIVGPRLQQHLSRAASTDVETAASGDAFAELVRMAVEKDPTLAPLAEQHLKQRQQQPTGQPAAAAARPATSMLGPSLGSLPNSSKPPWLRQRAPQGEKYGQLFEQMRSLKLATVCEEAQCPNIGECWNGDMGETQQETKSNSCTKLSKATPLLTLLLQM